MKEMHIKIGEEGPMLPLSQHVLGDLIYALEAPDEDHEPDEERFTSVGDLREAIRIELLIRERGFR